MIATEADIPNILDLCREAHVGSVWTGSIRTAAR